ncbi:MAG: PstS family phosphate ABC transporter substrate-binding protein [Cyanobacteria bacterium P01_F01_bin.153]
MFFSKIRRRHAALLCAAAVGGSILASSPQAASQSRSLVKVDGSSTVFPITEAVAEEFQKENSNIRVTVGVSGTGGGFKKFCAGETHISGASRPIKQKEKDLCKANNPEINYVELPVAFDAITVVINKENDWAKNMTTDDLKKMWEAAAEGKVMKWSDVRSDWPDEELRLYGPGTDSGTYDYFKEAILKKEDTRGDYTASEDDNVLVLGVSRNKNALGFFGLAYYEENKTKISAVSIDDGDDSNGSGFIAPSPATVNNNTYSPLSRPIFIYVNTDMAKAERSAAQFVQYYLNNAAKLSAEVGYVSLPEQDYNAAKRTFRRAMR